jgi:hypothetical protein
MTPTEIIAAFSALLILFVLYWFWRQDRIERRELKKLMDSRPSATKRYPLIVDATLDLDVTEAFYHKN